MSQPMTPSRGQLELRIEHGRIAECHPQLTLPDVASLLDGLSYPQVLQQLKQMFVQCGEAQRWAAVSLLEAELEISTATQAARAQALWLEWLSEHSWQLWRCAHLVLPHSDERAAMHNQWRQQLAAIRAELAVERHQIGAEVSPIAMPDLSDWRDQWCQLVYEPLLDEIAAHDWSQCFVSNSSDVKQLESGPAHRQHMGDVSISDRLEAIWTELWHAAAWALHPEEVASPLQEPGVVNAACGIISHHCEWDDGEAGFYEIELPIVSAVESIRHSLLGKAFVDSAAWRRGLSLWLQSHEPCIELELEFVDGLGDQ
ncbi:hypothetical protein [Ferrimonas senticii]|uniref:hypothetical protein n=1 Tax=Ferrimonas senticii TaxID=394566 RepID=UPI000425D1A4|nr:hypothetical protein [Ferrimonas senticii]